MIKILTGKKIQTLGFRLIVNKERAPPLVLLFALGLGFVGLGLLKKNVWCALIE